jgi:hypothetical protein
MMMTRLVHEYDEQGGKLPGASTDGQNKGTWKPLTTIANAAAPSSGF